MPKLKPTNQNNVHDRQTIDIDDYFFPDHRWVIRRQND